MNYQALDEAIFIIDNDVLMNESVESLLEVNLKESLRSVIDRIKAGIVKLIDKASTLASKIKNPKVKEIIIKILTKLRGLFVKADKITDMNDAKDISNEASECDILLKYPGLTETLKEDIEHGSITRILIHYGDSLLLDPTFVKSNSIYRYYKDTHQDAKDIELDSNNESLYEEYKEQLEKAKTANEVKDVLNSIMVGLKGLRGFNKEYMNLAKKAVLKYNTTGKK